MTSNVARSDFRPRAAALDRELTWLRYLVPVARLLFSAIFLMTAFSHFGAKSVGYAQMHGVPMANVLVPISGILAVAGGLSVTLGFHARVGAWLLVLFLVPVTLMMH